ncbi:MAG TPA: Crp/Fnr family transcriptional regulator [Oxalobacteraceae bacterium]|nr:Crp/Fnr family transcriptional regulator [Oxalobacteraceae bacterium]
MSAGNIKSQEFLSRLPLFNEMAPTEIDRIAKGTTEVRIERGETLFRRGDPCVGFHLVVYGQIKLAFISANGDEKVIELVGPGHSFGEALMFMEKPYIVTAQALADCLLLHVNKDVVFGELQRDPVFARKMLAGLSRRLHGLVGDVEAYSLRSGTERVIGYLLQGETEGGTITLQANKSIIASRLNLTPEHFSRVLHMLAAKQLISVSGKSITILDVERLRNYRD